MGSHVYVAVNERFGKLDCRTCGGAEDNPVHRSLTEQILADAGGKPRGASVGAPSPVLADRLAPDVRARMEAVITRQGQYASPVISGLVGESREAYRERMLGQPRSRAEHDAQAIVDAMAKLAPTFGVKRKSWADTSKWDRALWIATVREAQS